MTSATSEHPTYSPLHVAARSLGVPQAWLRAEAEAGRVPSIVAGRRRLFDLDQVRRALNERAAEQAAAVGGPAR